jgi:glycerol kinase
MAILVIDVGTSGIRAAMVSPDATVLAETSRESLPVSPAPGMVEFDAAAMAAVAVAVATEVLATCDEPAEAVGIANQRASTVVWDRTTGEPVGPGLGWQDLRTLGDCLVLQGDGIRMAPNQSATKLAWLLNTFDPERKRDLCFGTIDTWIAWVLTQGAAHVTDPSNAAVTGLLDVRQSPWTTPVHGSTPWNVGILERLNINPTMLPELVDTSGVVALATALPGAPPICALVGDQQASMVGQGVVAPGPAKITFGTGGMLDMCVGDDAPATGNRSANGTFPIVAWSIGGRTTWGVEAIMLSAGTNVEWLVDDLGIIGSPAESHDVAQQCATAEGVVYIPALLGLGTPHWDYGARGSLFGLTRGSNRSHVVRAVLEGIAHRGADLLEAAEADTGTRVDVLRVDGGMSANPTFVQALANTTGRPVETSPVTDATTMGAGYLAGLASGEWQHLDDVAASWRPAARIEPAGTTDRAQWRSAVDRARSWIPDLSALDF